ncbi:EST gb/ATTS0209 comes from this gene [Arabidopsis thaliana]|uniref:F19K23.14 protein n=2 Tax=Arabidopsis thaliana TaxID=3702 RepID=O04586_ARATH|nr:uncharacterized protein AT1G62210 [Arabidopsis thaliana]AAB60767.1 EST gb/ATTS0209 comes from this gene [Arabidopsis thaliana]AEE33936.1 hypothetical protein AT1G62210 [Arabidopsis thaliana]CAA0309118.1 unnamed protein product [Arabidopsis thaliana]CAD5316062.1 unnamed protein product [Arabidopsis thaliana]VYS49738.1 unnamed protein product [Arabidopsis thaliana]|eukprot:NP_176412.1 hypothetical protein AT1G62210 [Arabidopsis thaliana]
MNIIKLLVVVFIAALSGNVGARKIGGMANNTKLMNKKQPIGNSTNNVTGGATNGTKAPLSGGIRGVAPSHVTEGGSTNGTKTPVIGVIVGVSPIKESGATIGTKAPLNGVLRPAPLREGEATLATNNTGKPSVSVMGVGTNVQSEVLFTTKNFETRFVINAKVSEDGSNGGSGAKP